MGLIFNPIEGILEITRDSGGPSPVNPWLSLIGTIDPSTTETIDVRELATFNRLDYIINFRNPSGTTQSLKLVVQNNAGSITSVISERMGGVVGVSLNPQVVGSDMVLEVVNGSPTLINYSGLVAAI